MLAVVQWPLGLLEKLSWQTKEIFNTIVIKVAQLS